MYIQKNKINQILFFYLIYMKRIFWFFLLGIILLNTTFVLAQESENLNTPQPSAMGITLNENCILNWQCKFNIYEFLGIKKEIANASSPELFVQDILLSATFFIGTVVTVALVVSGLMFIFAGATGKDPTKAKAGIKNSIIWLLIVVCSYSIIRIVQYIAKWL